MSTAIFSQTLLITGIGMGLVFAGILCLWGLMELLVRFVHDRAEQEEESGEEETAEPSATPSAPDLTLKRKAAGLAVAVALARNSARLTVASRPSGYTSHWQTVRRSMDRQLNSQLSTRKMR